MESVYGNLPTFTAGQVLSAQAHLNALQRYITALRDDAIASAVPAALYSPMCIRHTFDQLCYSINCSSGPRTIKYGATQVASLAAGGIKTGTVDLSGFGLTAGEMYSLVVSGSGRIEYLYEKDTATLPTLASFNDATTPTAAEWQDLSDYAAILALRLNVPLPLNTRIGGWPVGENGTHGEFVHRGSDLIVGLKVTDPGQCEPNSERSTRAFLSIGGTRVAAFVAYMGNSPPYSPIGDEYVVQETRTLDDVYTIPLTTHAPALSIGTAYAWEWTFSQNGPCDGDGQVEIYHLSEIATASDSVAGWTDFGTWEHGDYVYGSTSAPNVRTIRQNLILAGGAVGDGRAYPCPHRERNFLFGRRRRRWLMYRTFTNEGCTLHYDWQGETKIVNLPESHGVFISADLEEPEGLLPGTLYWLGGTNYAFEDSVPYG